MPERAPARIGSSSGERRATDAMGIGVLHGCATELFEHDAIAATLRDDPSLRPRVREFSDWLLQPPAQPLSFEPLPRPLRAALHLPCTAASTMKSQDSLRTLLARVPGLEIVDLDDGFGCCGAAGSHFITHPVQADRMLAPKLDSIARLAPEIVFSANVGCSLHLAAGLRRAAATEETALPRMPAVPVVHPATWLARRLAR